MGRIYIQLSFWRRLTMWLGLVCTLFFAVGAHGQVFNEKEIKAGFLTRFIDFVDWPEEKAATPAVVGVVGSPDFLEVLKGVCAQQRARGRDVHAVAIESLEDLRSVRVAFIVGGASIDWASFSDEAVAQSVLVVGDIGAEDRLSDPEAMMQFLIRRNKIRFSINLETTRTAGLVISSKLARLAVKAD